VSAETSGDVRAPERSSAADGERVVPMRLQKFLARAGVASRRGSEDLMTAGRVRVNGVVMTELGTKVDPNVDAVTVDRKPVSLAEKPVYLVLNKPSGVVTTMSDPQGRTTVAALMPPPMARSPTGCSTRAGTLRRSIACSLTDERQNQSSIASAKVSHSMTG
jgi:hypothetical protein